jgi:plasmid stability protein
MKSITIHKLDQDLARELEERARREGISMNRLAKRLLRGALGLDKQPQPEHRKDFVDLFGTWSDRDAAAFDQSIEQLERVEPQEWE